MPHQHPSCQLTGPISPTDNPMPMQHSRMVVPLLASLAAATHQQASLAAAIPLLASLVDTHQLASLAVQQQGHIQLSLAATCQLASLAATPSSSSSRAGVLPLVVQLVQEPTHLPKVASLNRCDL